MIFKEKWVHGHIIHINILRFIYYLVSVLLKCSYVSGKITRNSDIDMFCDMCSLSSVLWQMCCDISDIKQHINVPRYTRTWFRKIEWDDLCHWFGQFTKHFHYYLSKSTKLYSIVVYFLTNVYHLISSLATALLYIADQ